MMTDLKSKHWFNDSDTEKDTVRLRFTQNYYYFVPELNCFYKSIVQNIKLPSYLMNRGL